MENNVYLQSEAYTPCYRYETSIVILIIFIFFNLWVYSGCFWPVCAFVVRVLVNIEHCVNPVRPQCQGGCHPADTYGQTPPTSAVKASPHQLTLIWSPSLAFYWTNNLSRCVIAASSALQPSTSLTCYSVSLHLLLLSLPGGFLFRHMEGRGGPRTETYWKI